MDKLLAICEKKYEPEKVELVKKAIDFAKKVHADQKRESGEPYYIHPEAVALILTELQMDADTVIAGLLHDTVEDTAVTLDEICEQFGKRVAELVAAESENKREDKPAASTWKIRKEETIEHLKTAPKEVKMLTLGDKLSNIRSICRDYEAQGDALWQRFNQKDKNEHRWYYKSIADCLSDLCEYPAYKEYVFLAEKTFGE